MWWAAILLGAALMGWGGAAWAGVARAQDGAPPAAAPTGSPMHPVFPLLDAEGKSVLESGAPLSTMTTCGGCHDTAYIAANSSHADVGLASYGATGGGRPWVDGAGLFGGWNAVTYRVLSSESDGVLDLTTPEWVQRFGARHAGGGPAVTSRGGGPLSHSALAVDTTTVNAAGEMQPWDWGASGTAELNCFTCHLPQANNEARAGALAEGRFDEATTATLVGTGIVSESRSRERGGWEYNAEAFDEVGNLRPEFVTVGDPTAANCGSCHGVVHNSEAALTLDSLAMTDWTTLTTGQIMSPQRISASGLNLADKATLGRSWDVHMERVVECVDCHYSTNNPIYYVTPTGQQLDHLTFDPRRTDFGEYLYRPSHQFAAGPSPAAAAEGASRCESCHSIADSHTWLPYKERHTAALACETCHTPKLYAPALQSNDWTVLTAGGEPVRAYRGLEGGRIGADTLITGYEPALLPRADDGKLAPFNLVASWYWVYGDPPQPVPLRDLQAAYFDGEAYAPAILEAFDADADGQLTTAELTITTEAQQAVVGGRLSAAGLDNPLIQAEVEPYAIHHNVTRGEWVTRDCRACHGSDSRLAAPVTLSDRTPGGVSPTLYEGAVNWTGEVATQEGGATEFAPSTADAGLYVLGHNASRVVDILGALMILGVSAGVIVHGGLRFLTARRRAKQSAETEPEETRQVYMYDVYERLWHWVQTAAILLLLFTGLIIHKPDLFGIFSFAYVVQVHNILAALLIINAGLSLFYHLASGEIKQFIPRPRGFFDEAFRQALYYLRGIFRREPHPFEKTRDRKLNPLQQITYVMVLNVLLPAQIITGALMWGAQRWPATAEALGGLTWLGPLHSLVAWSFTAFIILHVYLTTTGPTPAAGIKAMMLGWEEIETTNDERRTTNEEAVPAAD